MLSRASGSRPVESVRCGESVRGTGGGIGTMDGAGEAGFPLRARPGGASGLRRGGPAVVRSASSAAFAAAALLVAAPAPPVLAAGSGVRAAQAQPIAPDPAAPGEDEWLEGITIDFAEADAAIPAFTCTDGEDGMWGDLDDERHDNLVLSTDADDAVPGTSVTFTAQWEWRDWRGGAPLLVRACIDVDGADEADGEDSEPVDDLGAGPVDAAARHPEEEPDLEAETGRGHIRPVVRFPVVVPVPADAPPGGEVCVRVAVTGAEEDHRESPPLFDISESLCIPVAAPPPSPSPSPTPPPSPARPPSPTPTPVAPAQVLGEQIAAAAPQAVIPVTGSPVVGQALAGLGLVGSGSLLTFLGRRRRRTGRSRRRSGV